MEDKGFERASLWADRIQLFAFIAVLLIVSAAVWLASFFLIQPFVQDRMVQMLVASSISLALAGFIMVWRTRIVPGTILLFLGAGIIAISLALLWQSLQASILCLHGFLLASVAILSSLRKREGISNASFQKTGWVLGPAIILTGPLAIALGMLAITLALSLILAAFIGSLAVYVIGLQYLQKYARLGIPNVIIFSLAPSMLTVDFMLNSAIVSPVLLLSGFLISFGTSLFASAQFAKRLQSWAGARWVRKLQRKIGRESILKEIGLEKAVEEKEESPLIPEEWIIVPENANALSGLSLIFIASGIPSIFLWLSELTIWGAEPQFMLLMSPVSLIVGLLVLAPSPVLFRLGERITRDSEYKAVRAIGIAIVLLASASGFFWTQFYLWPILLSAATSLVLFIAGVTGLFRSIRRIWRRIWLAIVGHLRDLKTWILSHLLITGILADLTVCLIAFGFLDPVFRSLPGYPISILGALAAVFAAVGIIGLAAFRYHPRRLQLLSIAWIMLLNSFLILTLWNCYFIASIGIIDSVSYSLLWFLGSIALLKTGIRRVITGIAYLPGVLAMLYLTWIFETPLLPGQFPLLTLLLIAILPSPILHIEYRKAGSAISAAMARAARTIVSGVRRIGAALHSALLTIGRVLMKFILISWAVIVLAGLALVAWQWLAPYYNYDALPIFGWIALVFFLAYAPAIGRAEESPSSLLQVCILGVALALGILTYFYTDFLHIAIRILSSGTVACLVLTLTKSKFPEKARIYFIPTTWLMILTLSSSWIYLASVPFIGELQSALSTLTLFGLGVLPLKLMGAPSKIVNALYIILTLPSAVLLTHLVLANYSLTLVTLVLIPLPVAHRQYWNAISAFLAATVIAIRVILAYIAIYLVAAVALLAFVLAALMVYYMMPLFAFHLVPIAPMILTFILISMLIWFPALHLKRSENLRIHTVALIVLCAAISFDFVILLQIADPVLNILAASTIFSVLFTVSMPIMEFVRLRARSAAIALSAGLLLGLYLAPVDIVSKALLAAFGIALIAAPILSESNRIVLSYPVVTGALFAFLFWHVYLFTLDATLAVSGFATVESFLLSVPELLRNRFTWMVFAISAGVAIATILSPVMNINLVLAALVALEILRFTPGVSIREKVGMALGVARAVLVGVSGYLLIVTWIPPLTPLSDPLMAIGLSSLAATIILAFSMRSFISSENLLVLQSIAVLNLCFFLFAYLFAIAGFDIIFSAYIAGVPLLAFTGVRSMGVTFKRTSWMMFCLLATAMIASSWYAYYSSLESIWLCLMTAVFLLSSLRLTDPRELENKAGATNLAIAASIIMLEAIWIWHSILLFFFEINVIMAGFGILLTPVILFPLRGVVSWDIFRVMWSAVGATIAVSFGSLITGWNLYYFVAPVEPFLVFGVILSLFSLLTTPVFIWLEGKLKFHEDHLTARYSWCPSVFGWMLLGVQIGIFILNEIRFMLTTAGLGFALAVLVLYLLTPDKPRGIFAADIIILASAVAAVVWIWTEPVLGPAELIAVFLFVWYLLSLPLTIAATIAFLGWLAVKGRQMAAALSRFASWARASIISMINRVITAYRRNKSKVAATLPILASSLVILWVYNPVDTSAFLGLPFRNLGFAITLGLLVGGLFYWFEAFAFEPMVGDELRSPSMIFLGVGVNNIVLIMSLTEAAVDLVEFTFSLCLAALLSLVTIIAQLSSFGMKEWMRRATGIMGTALFGAVFFGLPSIAGLPPFQALIYATALAVFVEIPVFWTQVRAFLGLLGRLGARFIAVLKNLGSILLNIFREFGYYMWTFFALLFVAVIGVLSRPLFSQLLNMPVGGMFYEVPGFSMPAAILGLLMLFIAIARRRVRTRFGLFSGLFAAFGGGVTAIVLLYDYGYQVLSLFAGIIAICGTGLILKGELQLDARRTTLLWLPIPPSFSASLFYYMLPTAIIPDTPLLAMLISFTPTFMLYLLSTVVNWIPKAQREVLWSFLAVMTGLVAYLGSYLLIVPPFEQVAGIYLGVFVASLIMYPVTARSARQLFLSPLFFALTGFAYTFVLGPVYQSLLLASAAFLLFVSRYIKEKETENPKLVYVRLVVLIGLVASIAAFGITTGLEILATG